MARFGTGSKHKLSTVHPDLQEIFNEVIKHFDCTVTAGIRTEAEQKALYAKGRTEPGNIVTNADGVKNKSMHQSGNAVDCVPYPEMWSDETKLRELGWFVKGVAADLKSQGVITHDLVWGGLWDFVDMPHYEIKTN